MSELFNTFRDVLKDSSLPAFITFEKDVPSYLTAANIYTSILKRMKEFKRLGVKKNMVFIEVPDPNNCIINFMASLKLGAKYYPVSPAYLKNFTEKVYSIKSISELEIENDQDCCLILNSSGTKKQQRFTYTEEGILFQLNAHEEFFKKYPHEHKLSILPLFHCFGLILDYLLGIKMKKYITFLHKPSFHIKDLKQALLDEDIDLITGVPRHLELLNHYAQKDSEIAFALKKCCFYYGGATLSPLIKNESKELFKNILEGYGLTEAGPGVMMERQLISGVEAKLINNNLFIKSISIASNCIKDDGWYKTSDKFDIQGDQFIFLGRNDESIKNYSGQLLHFSEIENLIYKRFKKEILIIKNREKVIAVSVDDTKTLNSNLENWIKNNFPAIEDYINIDKSKILNLLKNQKSKSKKDIIKSFLSL